MHKKPPLNRQNLPLAASCAWPWDVLTAGRDLIPNQTQGALLAGILISHILPISVWAPQSWEEFASSLLCPLGWEHA